MMDEKFTGENNMNSRLNLQLRDFILDEISRDQIRIGPTLAEKNITIKICDQNLKNNNKKSVHEL